MYVVTFYSYKGGVGRSMALLNTAMTLAGDGKRVLVVDFDLEAPGLTTFEALRCARGHRGVVDFVSEYSRTAVVPDVADYIVPCDMGDACLWVMPAGDNGSPSYTGRLASIDWDHIYEEQEGFLMLEDLKTQWANHDSKGFDYVLLDSRTGHTDEGGICTRQLPDAVVVMFLPNEQNIEGLAPIVDGIREEARTREGGVALHFCPSNVPDEFDEHNVLGEMLDLAAERLGYADRVSIDQPAAVIHHWSSLELLRQPAMARVRPNSRLAKQYGELRDAVEASNLADEDGALKALARTQGELQVLRGAGRSADLSRLTRHVQEIRRLHPRSGRVAYASAQLFNMLKEPGLEVAALSDSISFGHRRDEARLARSLALHGSRQQPESIDDLRAVLGSPDATRFEIVPAFRVLTLIDPDWFGTTERLYDAPDIRFRSRLVLAQGLMTRRDRLPRIVHDMESMIVDGTLSDAQRQDARVHGLLARIGALDFEEVAAGHDRGSILDGDDPAAAFNLAIAEWGAGGSAPRDLLAHVIQALGDDDVDANGHQCLALAHSVLGDRVSAAEQLELARAEVGIGGLVFSCWRFLYATTEDMQADLTEMKQRLADGLDLVPPFLHAARSGRP